MGSRIIALADKDDRFELGAALELTGSPNIGADAGEMAGLPHMGLPIQDRTATEFDILIDFTGPHGTMHWLDYCLTYERGIVIGTTGHSDDQQARITEASQKLPVLKASNTSLGVNLLFKLVGQVAKVLGDDYDIEIVESHHRFKKDAPSGTAMSLLESILKETGRDADPDVVFGRHGGSAERSHQQIGMHSLRLGDTVGEHEIHFATLGESITLKHSAHTRDTFVLGALRAADWLHGKEPGLYDMHDVLGL
jgi:4-hydroxy-tetrahydrodipicolinate reductase